MRKLGTILLLVISTGLFAQSKEMDYMQCYKMPDFNIQMPNIFTPNGDYVNDHFEPIIQSEQCMFEYEMHILNRWGLELYQSSVYSLGWSGKTNYGDDYPAGTYFYYITYRYFGWRAEGLVELTGEKKGCFVMVR